MLSAALKPTRKPKLPSTKMAPAGAARHWRGPSAHRPSAPPGGRSGGLGPGERGGRCGGEGGTGRVAGKRGSRVWRALEAGAGGKD